MHEGMFDGYKDRYCTIYESEDTNCDRPRCVKRQAEA